MIRELTSLGAGILFGLGLSISQMMNPAKVKGFLDVAGDWDPSLAFVMAGALAVTAVGYRIILGRSAPLFAPSFQVPGARRVDVPLVVGAAIFGVGWGLGGFCPGPAVAGLAYGIAPVLVFVASMLAGMGLWEWRSSLAGDVSAARRQAVIEVDA